MLLCKKCGRTTQPDPKEKLFPVARCRVPTNYKYRSGYINNKKILGVGDMLAKLIKKIGYEYPSMGKIRARLTFLNKRSIGWCEKHQRILYLWLKEAASEQGVYLIPSVGKAIIRLAIMNAKNQQVKI